MAVVPFYAPTDATHGVPLVPLAQRDLKLLIDDLQVLALTNRRALGIVARVARVFADRGRASLELSS